MHKFTANTPDGPVTCGLTEWPSFHQYARHGQNNKMLHNLVFNEDYQHKLKSRTVWSLVSRSNSFFLMSKTNSRSTVVLRENVCPVLASSSESICNNVPQPLHDCSCGLNIFPESRVAVANGGFQSNLQTEKERKKIKAIR